MSENPPINVTVQFWILAALYASEGNWLRWFAQRGSTRARSRRHAHASRAKALVIHDRVLNQEMRRARLLEDRND